MPRPPRRATRLARAAFLAAVALVLPTLAAGSPPPPQIYVSHQFANAVSVVDMSLLTVVATIPVGQYPDALALNPTGSRLYVANFDDHTVSEVDTGLHVVTVTIAVGGIPRELIVSPTQPRLYVLVDVAPAPCELRIYSTVNYVLLAALPLPTGGCTGLAIHPSGSHVYVADLGDESVTSVDTSTLTTTTLAVPGAWRLALAINGSGSHLWVLDGLSGALHAVFLSGGLPQLVVDSLPLGHDAGALTAYGDSSIWVARSDLEREAGVVYRIGFERSLALLGSTDPGFGPRDLTILIPGGGNLWVLMDFTVALTISIIDQTTDTVVGSIALPYTGSRIATGW